MTTFDICHDDLSGAAQGSVPADDKEDVDLQRHEFVDDFRNRLRSPRSAQYGTPVRVDVAYGGWCQVVDGMSVTLDESLVAIGNPINGRDPVGVVQRHHQTPDDIVDSGTEAAARHDCTFCLRWVEEQSLPWPGTLDGHRIIMLLKCREDFLKRVVEENPVPVVRDKIRRRSIPELRQG